MDSLTMNTPDGNDLGNGVPTSAGMSLPQGTGVSGAETRPLPAQATTSLSLSAGVEPVPGYVLVRKLGQGSFGEVWEALAPGGVRVALKFIRLGTGEAALEARGLEVIRNIRHPHLLDVQFAVRVADCLVIAMPLCDESLLDRLHTCQRRGLPGLPRDELLGYMDEVAGAIDFLNEPRHPSDDGGLIGVQHRDIKPQNLFLVGGSVRLADFGLAKVLEASQASHSGCMSPSYAAPELLEGQVSQWTDQYALAVTYVQLRTGRLPFECDLVCQVLRAHLLLPPDLADLPGAEERGVVTRALAKRPDDRWPSCREFVLRLKEASRAVVDPATKSPATTAIATTPPAARDVEPAVVKIDKARRARWPRRVGLAGLIATAGLAAILVATRDRGNDKPDVPAPRRQGPTKVEGAGETVKAQPPTVAVAEKEAPAARERAAPASASTSAPARVKEVFRAHCFECHGGRQVKGKIKILDRDLLVKKEKVVPGQPDQSALFQHITGADEPVMPPEGQPRLSPEEIEAVRVWIAEGAAPFPRDDEKNDSRTIVEKVAGVAGVDEVLKAILRDVRTLSAEDRPFVRYFSLDHLRAAGASAEELDLHRDALAKAINHLSWERTPVRPQPIEPSNTVLRIDLRAWAGTGVPSSGSGSGWARSRRRSTCSTWPCSSIPTAWSTRTPRRSTSSRASSSAPPDRSGRSPTSAPTGS